jgi:diguanylate cyclase (GGDEF)-like protein/PAS domain S-box-containing protein
VDRFHNAITDAPASRGTAAWHTDADRIAAIQSVIDGIPIPISYVNRNGEHLCVNQASLRASGRTPAQVIHHHFSEFLSEPEALHNATQAVEAALSGHSKSYIRKRYDQSFGEPRWVRVTVAPDKDANEGVRGAYIFSVDIHEQRDAETRVQATLDLLDRHFDNGMLAIVQSDAAMRITRWSKQAERLFGYSAAEALGKTSLELGTVHPDDIGAVLRSAESLLQSAARETDRQSYYSSNRNVTRDGRIVWCDWYNSVTQDPATGEASLLSVAVDATERTLAVNALNGAATTDRLTGLPNRSSFEIALEDFIASRPPTADNAFALLFIDVGGFREINDQFGYSVGDQLLGEIAVRLFNTKEADELLARHGGDEFVILAPGLNRESDAIHRAVEIARAFISDFSDEDLSVSFSASIGVAMYPAHGTTAMELLRNADMASTHADTLGKNQVCAYSQELGATVQRRHALMRGLREALTNKQLEVHFQPISAVRDDAITGAEALVRWPDGHGGYIPPDAFISLAEESGLIHDLGAFVLRRACEFARKLNAHAGAAQRTVTVNVSAVQLTHGEFVERFRGILRETQCPPEWIAIEVTESAQLQDASGVAALKRLSQRTGVQCMVDDFGTGFSNLSRLRHLPVSTIKIDRSFIVDLSEKTLDFVHAIILLGHSIGLRVIAEGVEQNVQLALLSKMQCDGYQGFLRGPAVDGNLFMAQFGQPAPAP